MKFIANTKISYYFFVATFFIFIGFWAALTGKEKREEEFLEKAGTRIDKMKVLMDKYYPNW